MYVPAEKNKKNKNISVANAVRQNSRNGQQGLDILDNRQVALLQRKRNELLDSRKLTNIAAGTAVQSVTQLVLSQQDLEEWADMPDEDCSWMDDAEKRQLALYRVNRSRQHQQQQEVTDALASIDRRGNYVSWTFNGENYHINLKYDTYHVTWESANREHYFFKGTSENIEDKQPTQTERGQHAHVFSALPGNVQSFIKTHFLQLI